MPKIKHHFDQLVAIMQRLRHPENGCPWDLKQNESSLREYILEEAYELVEAIDEDAPEKIKEELGDLLLQIVFLSQIFAERSVFTIEDVTGVIAEKLERRHPHIFGDTVVASAEEVSQNWEKIKLAEKKKTSVLSNYPDRMPALLTAKRIASQAAGVGFDWNDAAAALVKVEEEIAELKQELNEQNVARAEAEIGDILFAVANVARLLHINPEFALARTNRKFGVRFRYIEQRLKEQHKDISSASLAEMEELWLEAKSIENESVG